MHHVDIIELMNERRNKYVYLTILVKSSDSVLYSVEFVSFRPAVKVVFSVTLPLNCAEIKIKKTKNNRKSNMDISHPNGLFFSVSLHI